MTPQVSLNDILKAAEKLRGVVLRTPLVRSEWLSDLIEGDVFLKLENLQTTGSFKLRGAYIKILGLSQAQRQRGIVAMSAGNHAQGVAYHAKVLGIPATIVMPENTPFAKIERTKRLGATIILKGQNVTESGEYALELVEKEGLTLIHPYDDPAVIAGQGTIALEMLEDEPSLDTLLIPIGGGGLAAGMAIVAKEINPKIDVFGVQSAYRPTMAEVLYPEVSSSREMVSGSPLAEGISSKTVGVLPQEILKDRLTGIEIVNERQIEDAIEELLIQNKLLAEGAGAVGVAALMSFPDHFRGKCVGIVVSGGNIDSRVISSLLLRGLVHQEKLVRLKIEVNDAPGVLAKLAYIIGEAGGNIYEVSHQRLFNVITVKMADIDVILEVHDRDHLMKIVQNLQDGGFPTHIIPY